MPEPNRTPADPLSDPERDRLEALLDALPPPLEPLALSALDGYLVGVLLQPRPVPKARWLAHVHDIDGRAAPIGAALDELQALVQRRHAELDQAIAGRRWFDPWVFEIEPDDADASVVPSRMVRPWLAGFSAALDLFPELLANAGAGAREPLATLLRHFDADDLEDVDDLQALMDSMEAPCDAAEAVEDLVRCSLLLADQTRPRPAARSSRAGSTRQPGSFRAKR
jgi:uncharacterized protein